ncbi:efflux RND transporter permease subunit [Acetonema longum]|uniref:Transporter, hydrophobe/amphiphile efflux-1 (HAE1) family protein n=1 Tax=Acetonema longum DSM 6540 TaxID=1009370 RepID=F7NII8_9FIRM|nr:multidrug efflux RND transporter permease subunit [Acetonema longum]EGO64134.1 transporter, hydrophobe/amphiphile efflux-1 (HAE1) family protein [Acetonema longum DSM 6540]
MAKFFIDRPVFAIVLSILIVLGGLISIFVLPVAQYPQISPPIVNVSASYVGANAEVVEQSIAQIIEQQVNGVEGAVSMKSSSSDNGRYSLDVQFEVGVDADNAAVQVQNRVAQANSQLPQEVLQAGVVTKKTSPDNVMFFALFSPNKTYDSVFLKNYGSIYVVEELKRVKGVGNVMEFGPDFGMRIWLRPDKMARLGITASDVYNAVKEQNVQSPAGNIGQLPTAAQQEFQYTARVEGRLAEPEEFGKIIIRSQPDGSFVRLEDVARAEWGAREYTFKNNISGEESTAFSVQLTSDANALETVAQVREVIENAAKRFPPDMEHKIVVDNTIFVQESLKEVLKTFGEALVLVLIIVFLFLQSWRATLIPMLAIPVSLIGTFAVFLMMGFTINTLTLFAMVLAVGLVVDDAIVVVEAVEYHIRYSGLDPRQATYRAMEEVAGPVVAIAFVLASVFIPVAFFGGTVGVLYKQFALTITVSMALSALVALTLTPALCAMLLQPHDGTAHSGRLGGLFQRFNDWFDATIEKYGRGVAGSIRRSGAWLVGLVVIVVLTAGLFTALPSSFVPDEDQGYFFSSVMLPEAASMNRTTAVVDKVGENFRSISGIENTLEITGFDILSGSMKPNSALVVSALEPWEKRADKSLQVNSLLRSAMGKTKDIPEAVIMAFNAPALPGVGSVGGLSLMLLDRSGGSMDEMSQVAQQFVAAARQRPEIAVIYSGFRSDTPGYRFELDREKAKALGVPVQDVFNALQTFLGGLQVNDLNRFGRTYKVIMQAESEFRADANAVRFLHVRSSGGSMVPLSTLVKPVMINAPTVVTRYNASRSIQITANAAPGYSSGQVITALEQVAGQTLPASFSYEWSGQSREEKISGGRAPIVFGFAILFSFLCLAALYESWSIPFAVLLSIPTGLLGSVLAQYARGLDVNVYMQIGLIMLIGLAAKNAILIVEFAKVRVDGGMDPVKAAIEACCLRLRPILMTSLAFIIGCLPLALAKGAGAGSRTAMGTAVVGGMISATVIGIFLVPVLFVVIERIVAKISGRKDKKVSLR